MAALVILDAQEIQKRLSADWTPEMFETEGEYGQVPLLSEYFDGDFDFVCYCGIDVNFLLILNINFRSS